MAVRETEMSIEASCVQWEKASMSTTVTESGMTIAVKLAQPLNAPFPTVVTESGMLIDERRVQLKNDRGAMLVIARGITTRAKESHPLKMSLPM